MISTLIDFKIEAGADTVAIQEELFRLGYEYMGSGAVVQPCAHYLYVSVDKVLTYDMEYNSHCFKRSSRPLVEVELRVSTQFSFTVAKPTPTVGLSGEYNEAELMRFLGILRGQS